MVLSCFVSLVSMLVGVDMGVRVPTPHSIVEAEGRVRFSSLVMTCSLNELQMPQLGGEEPGCPHCSPHIPSSASPTSSSVPITQVVVSGSVVPGSLVEGQCSPPVDCAIRNCSAQIEVSIVNSTGYSLTYQQSPNGFPAPRVIPPGIPPPVGVISYDVDKPCNSGITYTITFSGSTGVPPNPFAATLQYQIGCSKCL